jgi:hypothetical protein
MEHFSLDLEHEDETVRRIMERALMTEMSKVTTKHLALQKVRLCQERFAEETFELQGPERETVLLEMQNCGEELPALHQVQQMQNWNILVSGTVTELWDVLQKAKAESTQSSQLVNDANTHDTISRSN